jgi:hypothetical protein
MIRLAKVLSPTRNPTEKSMATIPLSSASAAALGLAAGMLLAALPAAAQGSHPNLSGFWEPRAGAMKPLARPALTPKAIELQKPPAPTDPKAILAINGIDETDINCLSGAQPWTLTQSAPIDIVQNDKELIVLTEGRGLPWRVFTDGRAHPDPAHLKPSHHGDSIGHWEGDEFVVDTIGFADHPGHGPFGDLPHNPTLHVTQRFHLQNNGEELVGRFTVEDPVLFSTPYVYDYTWHRDPVSTYAAAEVCDARDPANGHY